jgi:hypothetical protein
MGMRNMIESLVQVCLIVDGDELEYNVLYVICHFPLLPVCVDFVSGHYISARCDLVSIGLLLNLTCNTTHIAV